MANDTQRNALTRGAWSLWINWAYPFASAMIVVITGPIISNAATCILSLILVAISHALILTNRYRENPYCFLTPYIVNISLFWQTVIILIFDILSDSIVTEISGQPYNKEQMIMPIMFFAPISAIVTLWIKKRQLKNSFCLDCISRLGTTAERSLLGKVYSQEGKLQANTTFYISVVLTAITWAYYFTEYINTDYNSQDLIIFIWLPVAIYGISLIVFGFRYYSMKKYLCENMSQTTTKIRFLIFCGEKMCVVNNADLIDTPTTIEIPFKSNISEIEYLDLFRKISGINVTNIRFLYQSSDLRRVSNVFHYAVFLTEESLVTEKGLGQWIDMEQYHILSNCGMITTALSLEIGKIYTIVMTWKTYDEKGLRKYKIKYYQPTFRLSDMPNWDVDYNDPIWLFISKVNQDKPFYRIRSLWHKYISGIMK